MIGDRSLSVVSWGAGRLDIFGVGTDNALYHKSYDRQWSGWESLAGKFNSPPTAVAWGANRLDVFGRGLDNALYHKWWDGSQSPS
jgi:hypothetical protein